MFPKISFFCVVRSSSAKKKVGREILRESWQEFSGIFLDPLNKGSKFRGKFRSIFRKNHFSSIKTFRAKIRSADVPP